MKKALKLHPLQMVKKAVCQIELFSNSSIICKKDCPDIKNYRRNKKTHQGDAICFLRVPKYQ